MDLVVMDHERSTPSLRSPTAEQLSLDVEVAPPNMSRAAEIAGELQINEEDVHIMTNAKDRRRKPSRKGIFMLFLTVFV